MAMLAAGVTGERAEHDGSDCAVWALERQRSGGARIVWAKSDNPPNAARAAHIPRNSSAIASTSGEGAPKLTSLTSRS